VIVAAGYGTRFLPVTKTIPKEMLPLLTRPSIDFIIEEFIDSGIDEILVITSRRKKSLEDYLDREVELENILEKAGKTELRERIAPPSCKCFFVRQQQMMGTGHAILLAESFVGNSPFVVAYPDDLFFGKKPLSRQLRDEHERTGCSVLATINDPPDIGRYGVLALMKDNLHVERIVEKPAPGTEPSKEVSIGRFLFLPEIFAKLKSELELHRGGEFLHTAGINALAKEGKVVYLRALGKRLDTGEPLGYFEAILEYARTLPEYVSVLKKYATMD
jgi:UTP--glucose-1-phosphate uridylyltransferase